MNVIIKIQEREAIPIRALPFVAGFEQFSLDPILSPYLIAMSAGMPNEPSIGNGLPTYSIANNEVRRLAPSEWGAILDQADKPFNHAVRELPSGVFVFVDEFAYWFKWLRLSDNQPFDPAQFQINRDPLVPDALHDVVMEGLKQLTAIEAIAPQETSPQSASNVPPEIIARKKDVMVHELRDIWPNIENDLNNAGRNGLGKRAKLPKHGHWNMADALNWAFENRLIDKKKAAAVVGDDPTSELSVSLAFLLK